MLMARSTPAQKPRGLASRTSMPSILGFLRGPGGAHPVEDQQSRADRDRRVGEVEGPEMPAEGVEVEKVDDVAERDAVPKIAERAPQYQHETRGEEALAGMPGEHRHNDRGGENGDADEQCPLPAAGVRKKAERRPAVVREHKIEKRRDLAPFPEAERRADRALAHLVGHGDQRRDGKPGGDALEAPGIHAKRRGSPGPRRFDTQRPQIPGCFGSAPTSGRQCQQRWHLGCLLGAVRIASSEALAAMVTSAREVMSTKRSSSPRLRSSASFSAPAAMSTSA